MELTVDEKLLQAYQSIRRREHDLIHDLLPVLGKIDALPEQQVDQVRDALFHTDHPYLMVLVGPFNAGKSSIVNALMGGVDLVKIGATPTTDRIQILRWGEAAERMQSGGEVHTVFYPSRLLHKVSLVDTPGLESIFRSHEQTTRQFLHRADVVLLIMLATQVMTASNLETMQMFEEYGKKVIVVVNQCDLLDEAERKEVEEFVQSQSKSRIGTQPEIWMLSARQGIAAYDGRGERDDIAWAASGMEQIEAYIDKQLGDASRLRQKLLTPLQIVQNAHGKALTAVKQSQAALSQYQSINENIEGQLTAQRRENEKTVRALNTELDSQFLLIADRSGEALRDVFKLSRGISSFFAGILHLTALSRIFRGTHQSSAIEKAFRSHQVFDPFSDIEAVVQTLGPRLEGQDMQHIDDLVKYCQGEIAKLPPDLQGKVIGEIRPPLKYVRQPIQDLQQQLSPIEQSLQSLETEGLEDTFRNSLLYLAAWQLVVLVLLFAFVQFSPSMEDASLRLPIIMLLPLLALLGFLLPPVRGRALQAKFADRVAAISRQYQDTIAAAASKQIDHGNQLRRDTIAPLTRLIESQTLIHDEQMQRLLDAEQSIKSIESDLNSLGKRKILGVRL